MTKPAPSRGALPLTRLPEASVELVGQQAKEVLAVARARRNRSVFLLANTAASAAALLSFSGCGVFGGDTHTGKPAAETPTPPPAAPTNLADKTARDVDSYSKRVNEALATKPGGFQVTPAGPSTPQVTVTLMDVKSEPIAPPLINDTPVTPKGFGETPASPKPTATPAALPMAVASATPTVVPLAQPAAIPTVSAAATQPAPLNQPTLLSPTSSAAAMAMLSVTPPAAVATPETSLGDLIGQLRQRAQANPRQLNYALALQLLESAESNKAPDAASLSFLPATDQKLLTELSTAIQALAANTAPQGASLSERAAPLLSTVLNWQAQADLKLPRLVLASRVDSFGVFTPVEAKFPNGKRSTVIIYCEVANFASQKSAPAEDPVYLTHLTQQDTLITDDGLLVWRPNPEDIEDRSHNLRHDFYLVKKLTLPDTLPIGKYTLRMTVTDKLSNKIAMTALPIEITGK